MKTKKEMDQPESVAHQYLVSLGKGEVLHHPNGDMTPDFSVGESIGVEVTRLTQNYMLSNGKRKSFEHVEIPIWQGLGRMLRTFGMPVEGECWDVFVQYQGPVQWDDVRQETRRQLKAFKAEILRENKTLEISHTFRLFVTRASKVKDCFFVESGIQNLDAGGNILAEFEENFKVCLAEKEPNLIAARRDYSEWWLIVVNYVDLTMTAEDYQAFSRDRMPLIPHSFQKVIVIQLGNYENAVEL